MIKNNQGRRLLRAFVRIDGSGRVVPGSLILRKDKPKVGRWREIPAFECCNTTTTTAAPPPPPPTTQAQTTAAPTTVTPTTTVP
jgi:hypothetical protein